MYPLQSTLIISKQTYKQIIYLTIWIFCDRTVIIMAYMESLKVFTFLCFIIKYELFSSSNVIKIFQTKSISTGTLCENYKKFYFKVRLVHCKVKIIVILRNPWILFMIPTPHDHVYIFCIMETNCTFCTN